MKVYVRQSIKKEEVDDKKITETTYVIGESAGFVDLFQDNLLSSAMLLTEKLYAVHQNATAKFYETHQSLIVELLATDKTTTQVSAKIDDFEDPAIVKGLMPRITIVYLIDDITHFLGFTFDYSKSGVIIFQRPQAGDRRSQDSNKAFLTICDAISEYIDNVVLELCMSLEIMPAFTAVMPDIHWVVCSEYPDENLEAFFPDDTQTSVIF